MAGLPYLLESCVQNISAEYFRTGWPLTGICMRSELNKQEEFVNSKHDLNLRVKISHMLPVINFLPGSFRIGAPLK